MEGQLGCNVCHLPYTAEKFPQDRRPMIICCNGHTCCASCIEKLLSCRECSEPLLTSGPILNKAIFESVIAQLKQRYVGASSLQMDKQEYPTALDVDVPMTTSMCHTDKAPKTGFSSYEFELVPPQPELTPEATSEFQRQRAIGVRVELTVQGRELAGGATKSLAAGAVALGKGTVSAAVAVPSGAASGAFTLASVFPFVLTPVTVPFGAFCGAIFGAVRGFCGGVWTALSTTRTHED